MRKNAAGSSATYYSSVPGFVRAQTFELGVGKEADVVYASSGRAIEHFYSSVSTRRGDVCVRFRELFWDWKMGVKFCSSVTEIIMHPAYQQIIGLGPAAVPLMLKELQAEPVMLFHALSAVTSIDPVSPKDRGNVQAMADAWLRWGRDQKII